MGRERRIRIVLLVMALVSLVVVLCTNLWWNKEDAFGEVPVPGTATVNLPQGAVDIGFDAIIHGKHNSSDPLPPLTLWLTAPPGIPQADVVVTAVKVAPRISKSGGASTVWTAKIPETGNYQVRVEGDVSTWDEPRLTFGRAPHWVVEVLDTVFGIMLTIGAIGTVSLLFKDLRDRRRARKAAG